MGKRSDPWTFEKAAQKDPTFPYEHETAILYHGTSRNAFYTSDHTHQTSRNPASIFKQGFYSPGNTWKEGFDEDLRESADFNISKPGVYMGHAKTGALYAKRIMEDGGDAIVLKIEVPTKLLKTIFLPPRYSVEVPKHENYHYAEKLDDIYKQGSDGKKFYGSRKKFGENCQRIQNVPLQSHSQMRRNDDVMQTLKSIMFAVTTKIPFSPMEREKALEMGHSKKMAGRSWIKGVWDLELSEKPEFHDPMKYMKKLASNTPEKMPHGVSGDYKVFTKFVQDMNEQLRKIYHEMRQVLELAENGANPREIVEHIENYREEVQDLLQEVNQLESRRRGDFSWDPDDEISSLEGYEEYFKQQEHKEILAIIQFLNDIQEEAGDPSADYADRTREVLEDVEKAMNDAAPDMKPLEKKARQKI